MKDLAKTAKGTNRDKQGKSFVDSPTRKDFTAQETIVSNLNNNPLPVALFSNFDNDQLLEEIQELRKIMLSQSNSKAIENGLGNDYTAKVNKYSALKVFEQGIPDIDDPSILLPITSFLKNTNGSTDMRVNASLLSPTDFSVEADPKTDIYINTLSFLISDQNAILSNFGNINELTNGCQLILSTQEIGESVLADELKTNFSFVRLCIDTPAVSDATSAFRCDNISGNSEGYLCVLSINNAFGTKYGLRLRAGTKDRLLLRIRDNVSIIDAFNCLTYGTKLIN